MSAINGSIHGYESTKELTIGKSLQDNRGRHKSKTPTNEVERLRQEVRQLKAKAKEREVQIAFAKNWSKYTIGRWNGRTISSDSGNELKWG